MLELRIELNQLIQGIKESIDKKLPTVSYSMYIETLQQFKVISYSVQRLFKFKAV